MEALHQCLLHRCKVEYGKQNKGSWRAAGSLESESFFQGQPVTFSEEAFLAQKPGAPLQAFHRRAVHLQLFKQVRQNPEGGAGAGGARLGAQTPGSRRPKPGLEGRTPGPSGRGDSWPGWIPHSRVSGVGETGLNSWVHKNGSP